MFIKWLQMYGFLPMYAFSKDLDIIRLLCVLHVYNMSGHFFFLTAVRIVSL